MIESTWKQQNSFCLNLSMEHKVQKAFRLLTATGKCFRRCNAKRKHFPEYLVVRTNGFFVLRKYCANNWTNVHRNRLESSASWSSAYELDYIFMKRFDFSWMEASAITLCWKCNFEFPLCIEKFFADASNRAKLPFFVDFFRSFVIQSISSFLSFGAFVTTSKLSGGCQINHLCGSLCQGLR